MCIKLRFEPIKTTEALNYFAIKEGGSISKTKALKLLFFADRYHLRKYGRPISNSTYFAMKLGPVSSEAKNIIDENSSHIDETILSYSKLKIKPIDNIVLKSIAQFDDNIFSESDLEALRFSWNEFGEYNYSQLIDISHEYPEWKKHEKAIGPDCLRVEMDWEDFVDDPKSNVDHCFELSDADKEFRRNNIKEIAYLESLWD